MRVALACPYAWEAPGGVQVQVRDLAVRLRARGHEVLVLAPGGRGRDQEGGVLLVGRAVGVAFNGAVAPICPDPRSYRTVRRALSTFHADVVHVHEPFAPSTGMAAALAGFSLHVPVVATFHAYGDSSAALAAAGPLLRPIWRRFAARIAVSRAAASYVGARFRGGGWIVPNAVDVPFFRDARPAELPPGRRLLFVGRLQPRKGFPVAVEAFALLAGEFPDLWLVVAGAGEQAGVLDRLPGDVRQRVLMLGAVSNEELPAYHAAADLFIGPALGGESFGVVLAEALAAGLPVVASDIPGYREVVRDGIDGLLVPPGDPGALAGAAGSILRDPARAATLRAAAGARAEAFSWERAVAAVERLYERVAGPSGPAATMAP